MMLDYEIEEDKLGMRVTSGHVKLEKDSQNLIGISIGGGAPLCPCLYVVQVFDNTPAAKEGSLAAGDEIVGVNGQSVKGRTKVEVARAIQSIKSDVAINCNKLYADCAHLHLVLWYLGLLKEIKEHIMNAQSI